MIFLELFWQCGILKLFWQCGILELFWQCGILELFWQCGILELFWQCGILELFWQCGILELFITHENIYLRSTYIQGRPSITIDHPAKQFTEGPTYTTTYGNKHVNGRYN